MCAMRQPGALIFFFFNFSATNMLFMSAWAARSESVPVFLLKTKIESAEFDGVLPCWFGGVFALSFLVIRAIFVVHSPQNNVLLVCLRQWAVWDYLERFTLLVITFRGLGWNFSRTGKRFSENSWQVWRERSLFSPPGGIPRDASRRNTGTVVYADISNFRLIIFVSRKILSNRCVLSVFSGKFEFVPIILEKRSTSSQFPLKYFCLSLCE